MWVMTSKTSGWNESHAVIVSDAKREETTPSGIFCRSLKRFTTDEGIYTNCHCFCLRSLDFSVIFTHFSTNRKAFSGKSHLPAGVFWVQTARRPISISKSVNTQSTAENPPNQYGNIFCRILRLQVLHTVANVSLHRCANILEKE